MTFLARPTAFLAGAAFALASLAACSTPAGTPSSPGAETPPPSAGQAEPLSVAVAFYPFQFVAERVGGDLVTVENLTAPGAEPHDLELAPQQVALLSSADLVVVQAGFQPAVDAALAQANPQRTVDAASFLELIPATEDDGHGHGDEDADHEEEADHDEDGHEEDSHEGALDPHTWLDPTNLATVAEHVRDALIDARPEAAEALQANTMALIGELTLLDQEFQAGLASCQIDAFITSHAAFGYLAHRYHLEQVGIRGIEPDVEPTAARIAEVHEIAKAEGVTTIFFETLVSPVVSESIAGDLGLKTDVLDPLEGLTPESRGSDYLEVMRSNLASLRTANQCA
ncbi:MAG: zinc ABC transporter substrate-binding protein [Propionibacteriaceae bacterium]|nr:zinc ABC transporter substrate-binding protein [Propionibacteriaceae bacterium]